MQGESMLVVRFDRRRPNQRLKLTARVPLGNESFTSAPQLKREPLGRAPPKKTMFVGAHGGVRGS